MAFRSEAKKYKEEVQLMFHSRCLGKWTSGTSTWRCPHRGAAGGPPTTCLTPSWRPLVCPMSIPPVPKLGRRPYQPPQRAPLWSFQKKLCRDIGEFPPSKIFSEKILFWIFVQYFCFRLKEIFSSSFGSPQLRYSSRNALKKNYFVTFGLPFTLCANFLHGQHIRELYQFIKKGVK